MDPASHAIMQSLLDQARLLLAQGNPTKALQCVLAAVRHQRGEAGVFEVLNETREAHGLHRLASPPIQTQLGAGTSSAPRIASSSSSGWNNSSDGDVAMEDVSSPTSSSHSSTHSSESDAAAQVEALFRQLGVDNSSSSAPRPGNSFSSASASASRFSASAQPSAATLRAHHAMLNSRSDGFGSASSAASPGFSRPTGFAANPGDFLSDDALEEMVAAHAPAPAIHYPSMRTVLPVLSASATCTARLEEMHDLSTPAAASSSSSAYNPADPALQAVPLLSLAGRENILDEAYDSHSSVICPQCSALIPKARFQAHVEFWCQSD